MEKVKLDAEKLVQLRINTNLHLLQNPNYFGTLKAKESVSQFQPVQILGDYKSNYEELGCIDYNPQTRVLGAVVMVKQSTGYGSDACGGGSREYVRFFVDYDNNGTWIDEGLAELGVYNHNFSDDLCYYAQITLDPNKTSCCQDSPVLPNVRAILSWNMIPTAGDPNFPFIWGDRKEARIQIAPSNSFWCHIKDLLGNIKDIKINPEIFAPDFEQKYLPGLQESTKLFQPVVKQTHSPYELKRIYGKDVEDSRIAHGTIMQQSKLKVFNQNSVAQLLPGFDIASIIDIILFPKFNTSYEELQCVSLNRDLDTLHAAVQVKRKTGYLGDLCTTGSREYVAFYMDFGGGWEYMGTSSVAVHDINEMPDSGLWYDVALTINLDAHRKQWCEVGKARLKGILSWNAAPPANNPNYIAPYGDWEECTVEVKPLPAGVNPGNSTVVLEKVGGMVVDDINNGTGLATTNLAGSLGGALDSPFYGTMELIGHIFFATPGMSYRFLVTKPGGIELPLTDTQTITTDTLGIFTDNVFNPGVDGWIPYLQTSITNIVGGLLGRYSATVEGLHRIRIQAKDALNNIYDDVNGAVTILVDAHVPDVNVTIDPAIGGDCADFVTGTNITGTYFITDAHAGSFDISVTPNYGATVEVDGMPGVHGLSYAAGTLPNGGKSGTFVIHTAGVQKCGYNVRMDAWDRTIVSSHAIGLYNNSIKGFCLRGDNS